jgi:hypothetical protein
MEGSVALLGFGIVPLYWPQEIVVDNARQRASERRATVLASTSLKGHLRTTLPGLDVDTAEGKTLGKRPLIVMLEGKFESFWRGRAVPAAPAPR